MAETETNGEAADTATKDAPANGHLEESNDEAVSPKEEEERPDPTKQDVSPDVNDVNDEKDKDKQSKRIPSDRILLYNLSQGFASLSKRRAGKKDAPIPISEREVCSCATVNFIDPTASLVATKSSSKFNILSPLSKQSTEKTTSPSEDIASVDLYSKLTSIFDRDYSSMLQSVPYQNIRSGKQESIERLYIRSIVTKAHGVGDTYVPWGGTAATQASPMSDPAEWHSGPHCHVYIAACEGTEHYRQKVKPALQAFVSQIEGAAGNSSTSKDGGSVGRSSTHVRSSSGSNNSNNSGASAKASSNHSPHYVIVYVPINRSGASTSATPIQSPAPATTAKRMGTLASRMRRQIQHSTSSGSRPAAEPSDSNHSGAASAATDATAVSEDGDGSTEMTPSDPAAAPPPGPISHSSRVEKELYRKFTTDFPNGQTCIMTTLIDSLSETSAATTSPLKNQEWNTFLRMMGSAIVSGFKDRCRRYDEELRRLDTHRAAARSPKRRNSKRKTPEKKFDLSHFFLVKESLAFTYEQMQLPAEALLQYVELGAFVMEAATASEASKGSSGMAEELKEEDDYDGLATRRSMRKIASTANIGTAMDLAVAGDTAGFRRRLRGVQDLIPELSLVLQYLYSREISLLFQLSAPVEVINRSKVFIQTMYTMRLNAVTEASAGFTDEDKQRKRNEAEKWALAACWDVKCSCDILFSTHFAMIRQISESSIDISERQDSAVLEEDGNPAVRRRSIQVDTIHVEAACRLSELLDFARMRLLYLGDKELDGPNPIRSICQGLPEDMKKPWTPWKAVLSEDKLTQSTDGQAEASQSDVPLEERPRWLDDMFDSQDSYESKYVEMVSAIIALCRLSGRRRIAARLQAERAEIHIRRGEYELGMKLLLPAVNICAEDRWDRGHFWRLFRLACCQRVSGDAASYLNTLTRCFGERLAAVAPRKASEFLQQDLEAVVADEEISKYHLGISPFLETDLVVEATSAGNLVAPSSTMRKKVVKHFCSVGETAGITLTVTSHLPKPIHLDSVRLFLVTFDKYEAIYANRGDVEEEVEGAFQILPFVSPMTVNPGRNEFKLDWVPMCTGEFILSTVEVRWKASCFFYRSCAMRKPLLEIDVVPSDPTQTVELHPLFLMPGHVQPVRISFHSGSDVVIEGSIELTCSDGLQVTPPGADPTNGDWATSCNILVPPCPPGETVVITTSVKSSLEPNSKADGEEDGDLEEWEKPEVTVSQTMRAVVSTLYHHASYDKNIHNVENSSAMKASIEATVTTLDRPALTLDSSSALSCTTDLVMVRVSLNCNTPVPFYIKEWEINLPEPLYVEDGGDLNKDLYGHAIAAGETLSFGFQCGYSEILMEDNELSEMEPRLHVVLQDESGKEFNQVLALDLDDFYRHLRDEDEHTAAKGVAVELRCSSNEGLVGAPVNFTYHVDTSTLTQTPRRFSLTRKPPTSQSLNLLYAISCEEADWIVGGKVEGILSCESGSVDLEFVGIPTSPGVLKSFPSISLQYVSSGQSDSPPIMVHSQLPDCFKSTSYINHMAVAYPAQMDNS